MSRLFVAAWPPADVLDELDHLDRPELDGLRWTQRRQWHVTLRFLGEADEDQAGWALAGLRARSAIAVAGPQARWLGRQFLVLPVAGLDELAGAVTAATAGVGRPEGRPFRGHLTLARARRRVRLASPVALELRWPVGSVALVRSELAADGARYTNVVEVPLAPWVPSSP